VQQHRDRVRVHLHRRVPKVAIDDAVILAPLVDAKQGGELSLVLQVARRQLRYRRPSEHTRHRDGSGESARDTDGRERRHRKPGQRFHRIARQLTRD
jgi:hypothetical protein